MIGNELQVLDAHFIQTGTTQDMVGRSMITHVPASAVRLLAERSGDGTRINAENLVGVAGNILQPDMNTDRHLQIANGWNTPRYRFLLRVGNPNVRSGTVYFYSGYTDTPEFSFQRQDFAPDMRMFFNNVLEVSQTTRMGPNGPEPIVNVAECSHLIHPASLGSNRQDFATTFNHNSGFAVQNQPSSLRPVDVISRMALEESAKIANPYMGDKVIDLTQSIDLRKTSRRNGVPSYYLNRTAEGLAFGFSNASDQPNASRATPFEIATGFTDERSPFADRFFTKIAMEYGYHQNGFVTWGDFCRSHPEMHTTGVTKVLTSGDARKKDVYISERGDFDPIVNDRRAQTMFIHQIMQSMPAVLLESLLTCASIHVTNMTVGMMDIQVTITNPLAITELPTAWYQAAIPRLEQRLKHIIFSDLGVNTSVPFDCWLTVDLFGETFANLSYNGEKYTPYSIPTYCDAMMSPIVTTNGQTLGKMANDLNYIFTQAYGL